jgi:hypothetical protein
MLTALSKCQPWKCQFGSARGTWTTAPDVPTHRQFRQMDLSATISILSHPQKEEPSTMPDIIPYHPPAAPPKPELLSDDRAGLVPGVSGVARR